METLFEVKPVEQKEAYGKFEISPLQAGYGQTLGVALRRVLLTSLSGAAITQVKLNGVKHQFSTLKGMKEDVLDFVLNLKRVNVRMDSEGSQSLKLNATGPGEVKAGDIEVSGGVTITNPDLVLANLSKGAKLEATFEVESGVGYSPATEREESKVGYIPVDALFSPVERVNHKVEDTRVGRVTNYDKLTLEVWTDGTIDPLVAVQKAAQTLVTYFSQIVTPQSGESTTVTETTVETESLGPVGNLSVEEIGLPTRVANALVNAGFDTVSKLATADPKELEKVRNLGGKSVDIIRDALNEKGVEMQHA